MGIGARENPKPGRLIAANQHFSGFGSGHRGRVARTITVMEVCVMRVALSTLAFLSLVAPLSAQTGAQTVLSPPPVAKTVSLSGPRFGITSLGEGVVAKLQERSLDVRPMISQFGWQFERQFYAKDSGVAAVNEWVVLVGGLDQGVALPSVSWLVGLRTREGTEVGIGPNVTPIGVSLALAAGVTLRAGLIRHARQFSHRIQHAESMNGNLMLRFSIHGRATAKSDAAHVASDRTDIHDRLSAAAHTGC
jgi:hypothetical protein